jgi:hypothetical protein
MYKQSTLQMYLDKRFLPPKDSTLYINTVKQFLCSPRLYDKILKKDKSINFDGLLDTGDQGVRH